MLRDLFWLQSEERVLVLERCSNRLALKKEGSSRGWKEREKIMEMMRSFSNFVLTIIFYFFLDLVSESIQIIFNPNVVVF